MQERFGFNTAYQAVAASQTLTVLGAGLAGALLERLVVVVATSATSAVSIRDGAGGADISVVPANAPVGVYHVEIGARARSAGWRVTTAAGVSVIAVGQF